MKVKVPCKSLTAVVLLLTASVSAGQLSATLSGPTMGYVWNGSEGTVRPVLGVPGNAVIGDPADIGLVISQALSLNGRHILASTNASSVLVFVNMDVLPPAVSTIADASASYSLAAASRTGSAAALYYHDQQSLLIVTGFPRNPKVTRSIDSFGIDGPVTKLAVSDDGDLLVYAVSSHGYHTLYAWTPATGARVLTIAADVAAIALTPGGDAIVADAGVDEIFSILDPRGTAARYFLADGRSGVSNPRGVAVSNADRIIVANAGAESIMILDSTGRLLRVEHCSCDLTGLYLLQDSIYRLSDRADRPIFILEVGPYSDRLLFIPMLHAND